MQIELSFDELSAVTGGIDIAQTLTSVAESVANLMVPEGELRRDWVATIYNQPNNFPTQLLFLGDPRISVIPGILALPPNR